MPQDKTVPEKDIVTVGTVTVGNAVHTYYVYLSGGVARMARATYQENGDFSLDVKNPS